MDRCLMIKINALLDELVPNNNKTSLIMIHKCIIETKEWFGTNGKILCGCLGAFKVVHLIV